MPPESLDDVLTEARALADTLDAPDHETTDDERAKADELLARATAAATAARQSKADNDRRDSLERLFIGDGKTDDRLPARPDQVEQYGKTVTLDTPADVFMRSKSYEQFKSDYPDGMPDSAHVHLPPVRVPGLKATTPITSGGAGALVAPPDRLAMPSFPWGAPLTILDAITHGTTGSDTVEFAQLTSQTSSAAPVAEASDTAGASGLKPQSNLLFGKVTAPVRTIAHWLAATKRSLSDAGQLATLINSFLSYGVDNALQNQVVNGDGTGENFRGILATTGVLTIAWPGTGTPVAIDQIRKGVTAVTWTGLAVPNAIALNPQDAESIDLAKDTQNRYYGNGPFGIGPPTLWGLPRIVSDVIPAKKAIVGDFRQAVLWDREQTTITASDSHADFFTRNLVAILAEHRAAFGVFRPSAFCVVATAA